VFFDWLVKMAVLKRMPRIERLRRDLIKAGIEPTDKSGQKEVAGKKNRKRLQPLPKVMF
jgi:hypothetical protein